MKTDTARTTNTFCQLFYPSGLPFIFPVSDYTNHKHKHTFPCTQKKHKCKLVSCTCTPTTCCTTTHRAWRCSVLFTGQKGLHQCRTEGNTSVIADYSTSESLVAVYTRGFSLLLHPPSNLNVNTTSMLQRRVSILGYFSLAIIGPSLCSPYVHSPFRL